MQSPTTRRLRTRQKTSQKGRFEVSELPVDTTNDTEKTLDVSRFSDGSQTISSVEAPRASAISASSFAGSTGSTDTTCASAPVTRLNTVQSGRFLISDLNDIDLSDKRTLQSSASASSLRSSRDFSQAADFEADQRSVQSGRFRVVDIGRARSRRMSETSIDTSRLRNEKSTSPSRGDLLQLDPLQLVSALMQRVQSLVEENAKLKKENAELLATQNRRHRTQRSSLN